MLSCKHRRTFAAIFDTPTRSDIRWSDIESLLLALGAEARESKGSGVRFILDGRRLGVHRPHPSPTTRKWAVELVRDFLKEAGVSP